MAILLIASVGIVPAFAAAPAAPSKVVSAQSTSAIKLTWTKVSGATGYRIYYKLPGDITWRTALSSTGKTTHTFTGLPEAQSYLFAVRSYSKSGSKVTWGGYRQIATATQTSAPKKIIAERSVSAIRLTWSEVETATGYRILYKANSADEWKTAATTKNTTHTFKNLPAGKKYSFAVQSYVKSSLGTFYGRYITVETATKPATLNVKATATESAITLSWGKVSADGYRVYYKLPSTNWGVAVNTTTATKVTFKNVDATKGYSFIVRPYVKTASGVIWGGYKEILPGFLPSTGKEQIVSNVVSAVNRLKSQKNMTVHHTENISIGVTEIYPSSLKDVMNNVISNLAGEPIDEIVRVQNGTATYADGTTKSVKDVFSPSGKDFTLTADGVGAATATKQGENTVYTVVLVSENTTAAKPVPKHNSGAIGYFNLMGLELPSGKINKADISYPGSTVEVTVNPAGQVIKLVNKLPMTGDVEFDIAFVKNNKVCFEGELDEVWEIRY